MNVVSRRPALLGNLTEVSTSLIYHSQNSISIMTWV